MRFVSELLSDLHELSSFESGNAELDGWLRDSARQAASMNTGRTFAWHLGDRTVVGYFTLAAHLVGRA